MKTYICKWSTEDECSIQFLSQTAREYVAIVQSLSCVQLFATPWTVACQASLSFTISQSLLKLMSIESVMPSRHLILRQPLLLLPSIFPSIRIFSKALCIRWPKYWTLSFSIRPSNEYSGLISFRMNCLDPLAVQGILKSHLQHHSSKASILWPSAFFIIQLSHLYVTRRQWQPTPVLLPGESHGWRSLVGCGPWGREESDMTERLHFHFSLSHIGEGNGNPLQCSSLKNPRDGGAWWAAVYGVAQSRTRLKRLSSSNWKNHGFDQMHML